MGRLDTVVKIAAIIGVVVAVGTLIVLIDEVNTLRGQVSVFQDEVSAIRESTNATLYIFNESTKPVKQSPYLVDCKIEKFFYTNKVKNEELYYDVYIPMDVYISDIHGQSRYYVLKISDIYPSPMAIDNSRTRSFFIKPEQVTNEIILIKLKDLEFDKFKSSPHYEIEIEFEYIDYTTNQKNYKRLNVGEISFFNYSHTDQKIGIGYRNIFGDYCNWYPQEKLDCYFNCDDLIYEKLDALTN